jgi:hypothetical protein
MDFLFTVADLFFLYLLTCTVQVMGRRVVRKS